MNKKEIKQKIAELINAKKTKSEVYKILTEQGENISLVAYLIASNPDPIAYEKNYRKINTLITIMFITALLAGLIGHGASLQAGFSKGTATFVTLSSIAFPLLLAYGFYKNYARAYNTKIIFSLMSLPLAFINITKGLPGAYIGLGITLVILAFVWHLRSRLFPDFSILKPKKVNGKYIFTN